GYLAIGVPEGTDVSPLGALLGTDTIGEKARTTLTRLNTVGARAELVAAIGPADPDLTINVLGGLAEIRQRDTVEAASAMLSHGHAPVRAAAAQAVAWTGDLDLLEPLKRVARRATPETQFAATDALIRYGDALASRGGNWQLAINLLLDLLGDTEGVLLDATLMALGKHGDETVIEPMIAAAKAGELRNRQALAMALGSISGRGADRLIATHYPTLPDDTKLPMLAMMARRGSEELVALVAGEARTAGGLMRPAALEALAESASPAALPVLVEASGDADESVASSAVQGLWDLAGDLRASGRPDPAGVAYAHLYRLTDNKDRALAGVVACPSAPAFDVLLGAGGGLGTADLPAEARVAMISALFNAGEEQKALEAVDEIVSQPMVGAPVAQLLAQLGDTAWDMGIPSRLGFITDWHIVGPFAFGGPGTGLDETHIGEPGVDLSDTYTVGDETRSWQPAGPTTMVNLHGLYGAVTNAVAYGYAQIESDEERDVVLRMASDDGIKVWVNGEVVHNNDVDRGAALDQDMAPAHLVGGTNRILVKCSQGGGGWNFTVRVTTPEGVAIPIEQPE
ncbi:MAG: hypothetical protein GF320_13645, partial [Armatimonadia bacterium]|nr:hypothetical protein [Armatimonadia bacterium]